MKIKFRFLYGQKRADSKPVIKGILFREGTGPLTFFTEKMDKPFFIKGRINGVKPSEVVSTKGLKNLEWGPTQTQYVQNPQNWKTEELLLEAKGIYQAADRPSVTMAPDVVNGTITLRAEKGPKGDKGEPGRDGRDGQDGKPGQDGMKGEPGNDGQKGEKGDKGSKGEDGRPGKDGKPGKRGKTGGKGDKGEKGDKGDKGEKGEPGADGRPGICITGGGGGEAAWGEITGTLSEQTDLQDALDAKADTAHSHVESDITDLDHDAQKIKGKVVDDTAIGDGKSLVYSAGSDKIIYSVTASTDEKAKVSSNDSTPGYLNGKLVSDTSVVLTEQNDTGDETLQISVKVDDSSLEADATEGVRVKTDGIKDTHIDWGLGAGQVCAADIPQDYLSGSTWTTLQDFMTSNMSAGVLYGGTISDNGDGTIATESGKMMIRKTNSSIGDLVFADFAASASIALTDNALNFIYCDYNGGSPTVAASISPSNLQTQVCLGQAYREGTDLTFISTPAFLNDFRRRVFQFISRIHRVSRADGMIISENAGLPNRYFSITSGTGFICLADFSTDAFDSETADTFTYYYRDGAGGFTKQLTQSVINNLQYDDGSGTLATLGTNEYGVHWVYMTLDSKVHVVYGHESYLLADAQNATAPADIPDVIDYLGLIVGRIIIKRNQSFLYEVDSAFSQVFESTLTTDHEALGNLLGGSAGNHWHLSDVEYTELSQWLAQVTLTNTGDLATPGEIRWQDADLSNYVGFKAPATVASDTVWTLPSADGTPGQYLKTDGSKVLSWGTPAVGGGGLTWEEVTSSQSAVADYGYSANGAGVVTLTLPVTAAFGTSISFIAKNANGWKIAQNAGQSIIFGNKATTAGTGGYIQSNAIGDCLTLVCVDADTVWAVQNIMGNPDFN